MNAEYYFINTFRSLRSPIGDDGACIDGWVYSKDIFFENVHFKRAWLTPYQIGYKAMLINISDAVAMNADPKYALLGVAMPKSMPLGEMDELSLGLKSAAEEFGIQIIGGDTISNKKLDISITIVSKSREKLLTRRGLKTGDMVAHTGKVGESAKELRYLMAGGKVHTKSCFVSPVLRQEFVRKSSRYLRCGMDISDGIYSDTEKLCRANRIGIRFYKKMARNAACSGEEYEMLIAFSPANKQVIRRIAALTRTPVKIIGRIRRGKFTNRCKAHHF